MLLIQVALLIHYPEQKNVFKNGLLAPSIGANFRNLDTNKSIQDNKLIEDA